MTFQHVYIYSLADPRNPDIVMAVGKTSMSLKARLSGHVCGAYYKHKRSRTLSAIERWVVELRNAGVKPIIGLIEECSASVWKERERYHISSARAVNSKLLNILQGGDGPETRTPDIYCRKCGELKIRQPSGWRVCRKCKRDHLRKWYGCNKEYAAKRRAKYENANREYIRSTKRQWYAKNWPHTKNI